MCWAACCRRRPPAAEEPSKRSAVYAPATLRGPAHTINATSAMTEHIGTSETRAFGPRHGHNRACYCQSAPPPADRIRPDQPENTARSRLRASRWAEGDTSRLFRSPWPSGRVSKGCYPGICGARVAGFPARPEHLEDSAEWPAYSLTGPMKGSTHDQREMPRPARPGASAATAILALQNMADLTPTSSPDWVWLLAPKRRNGLEKQSP